MHMTCFIRSNDMFMAWPQNAFGLRKIQQEIANAIELSMGSLTIISSSAHIYENNWADASEIAKTHSGHGQVFDQRGNIVISFENGVIVAKHYSQSGKFLNKYSGNNAKEVYLQLARENILSDPGHMMYIGAELMNAERDREQ